jgi:hypothetical protein
LAAAWQFRKAGVLGMDEVLDSIAKDVLTKYPTNASATAAVIKSARTAVRTGEREFTVSAKLGTLRTIATSVENALLVEEKFAAVLGKKDDFFLAWRLGMYSALCQGRYKLTEYDAIDKSLPDDFVPGGCGKDGVNVDKALAKVSF